MKKILSLSLTLMLVLSLAACSGDTNKEGKSDNKGDSKNNQTTSQSKNDDASEASASEASASDTSESDAGDQQGNTNLIPIGTTATATFENRYGVKTSASMCVDEIIRGEDALAFINDQMMAEKSMWSAEAPEEEDQEYIVAKITYSLLAYDEGDESSPSYCYAYSATFEPYVDLLAAMYYDADNNYPELSSIEMKVGETVSGYEIFQVSKSDDSPVMAYRSHLADLSDGLWFKLY